MSRKHDFINYEEKKNGDQLYFRNYINYAYKV